MSGTRSLNPATDSQSRFSRKRPRSSILEIDSWMASKIQAISPTVDRLMRLIAGSQCISGNEFDVELALREALEMPLCTAIRKTQKKRSTSAAAVGRAREFQSL